MAEKKEPKLDFPGPSEAYHNEEGMFTMKEPEPGTFDEENMVELKSGLYAPKPKLKEYRIIWLVEGAGQFQLEVEESYEDCEKILAQVQEDTATLWYTFLEPRFGFTTRVPRAALLQPICIITGLVDIEQLKEQQEKYQFEKRMAKLQNSTQGMSPQQARELLKRRN